ncbi:hypothetical protein RND81_10G235600 [Saponaria officinalis]|uniref:Uncharacterized protein n=1 Tax=Saponaria officinalis TaxID=3572 RepID=A0AAW1I5J4_SAPOF
MDEVEDEDSRLFLSMLEAAAESIFDACSQIVAAESGAISAACGSETAQQSTSSVQQDNELFSGLSPMNAPPPAFQASISPSRPRKRRRRSWTSVQSVQQQPFPTEKTNFRGNEITLASVGWPQNFSAPSNVFDKPFKGFNAKETLTFAKNINRHQSKRALRKNVGPVGFSADGFLPGDLLPPVAVNDGKCETENSQQFDDFAKEIHEAIDRIESLIPSLQKLVNCVQTTTDQKVVGNVELRNTYSSICDDGKVNRLKVAEIRQLKYDHEASKSHARDKTTHLRDSVHRDSISRKSMNGASQSKITRKNRISEETSCSSPASFSGSSTTTYSSGSDEPDTYTSGSDETCSGSSPRTSAYETSSESISQDEYSDTGVSRQSSERTNKWDDHLKKGKKVGRISTLRRKLGLIFHHHHHHHHHHYSDRDESNWGHVGLLKRLGKMFHRRGKTGSQRRKAKKCGKPVTKSVVKKKQDVGHIRALINGLIRHMRHSEKSKKAKDDVERLVSGRHRGKKGKKKSFWWPKMGQDGVKVAKKGKVKLGRVGTRAKRPLMLK